MGQYIDFGYVKQHADFGAVLAHYNIEVTGNGDELRCSCPFHEDDRPSLTINHDKSVFNCHAASCGEKGNILDFVALMEEVSLRNAAQKLAQICKIDLAAPRQSKTRKSKSRAASKPVAKSKTKKKKKAGEENEPLNFTLKLDPDHPYGKSRSLSPSVISQWEMGHCSRGIMKDRWCAPVHNAGGDVVAYIGRYAASEVPEDTEKYRLPKGFKKDQALFNLHRIAGHTKFVAIVEGVFDVARLHSLEMPAVGLLGTSISDKQIELLKEAGIKAAVVLLDAGSKKAERKLVHRLSCEIFVRSVALPDGEDPATVSEDFLREKVPLLFSA